MTVSINRRYPLMVKKEPVKISSKLQLLDLEAGGVKDLCALNAS